MFICNFIFSLIEKTSNNHKFIGVEPLDVVKFVCKEFWEEIFRKKVKKKYITILLFLKFFYAYFTLPSCVRSTSCRLIIKGFLCSLI